ncbi:MAG: GspE/PulE family protein [Candidatus Berkelbacteria bacterium]
MDLSSAAYFLNRNEEEAVAKSTADIFGLQYVNLSGYPFVREVIALVPEELALSYQIIPYLRVQDQVRIAAVDPQNEEMQAYLNQRATELGVKFKIAVISRASFQSGFAFYKKFADTPSLSNNQEKIPIGENITDIKSAAEAAKQTTVTELMNVAINGALKLGASDVHFEPYNDYFAIRYRIDGVLQDIAELGLDKYKQVLARIKYLAKIRLDISDHPQDGRFTFDNNPDETIDIRVSIMPTSGGESIVLRLLGQGSLIDNISKLGFRADAFNLLKGAISKPHGMILTSGPTGSGKTTTLYAALMTIRKPGTKIITLENPIEYRIDGIEQSQVDAAAHYDFAEALKASLRQDPDVLMVGEIRDQETAKTAIEAAMTGHLLLSTIHANSAPAVFVRLAEIGVEPYLLSGSINLIMAQRLVRKVCPHCLEKYTPPAEVWTDILKAFESIRDRLPREITDKLKNEPIELVRGKGCDKCNFLGFKGRQAIIECLEPSRELEILVGKKSSISDFEIKARELGMVTMEQDGLLKVLQFVTTPEEIWRATKG